MITIDGVVRVAIDSRANLRDLYAAIEAYAEAYAEGRVAEEREACALLCDELATHPDNSGDYANGAGWCRERIRARGNP